MLHTTLTLRNLIVCTFAISSWKRLLLQYITSFVLLLLLLLLLFFSPFCFKMSSTLCISNMYRVQQKEGNNNITNIQIILRRTQIIWNTETYSIDTFSIFMGSWERNPIQTKLSAFDQNQSFENYYNNYYWTKII